MGKVSVMEASVGQIPRVEKKAKQTEFMKKKGV